MICCKIIVKKIADEYGIKVDDVKILIQWEEFKAKKHKLEHMKSTKYHYHVLMIKDTSYMMVFIHLLIFIKTWKSRIRRLGSYRFSKKEEIQKDSNHFSHIRRV